MSTRAKRSPTSPAWATLLGQARRPVGTLAAVDVPTSAGVYLWRKDDVTVYVGTAKNLRERVWKRHLRSGPSLANSSLRRNVCELLFDLPPAATGGPKAQKVSLEQAAAIRAWLASCEISWQPCDSEHAASALEALLRGEFRPPLNRI